MVLVLAVAVGLVLGRLLGGRIAALAALRIRAVWLFYVAIALQVAGYPSGVLPWSIGDSLATGLWLVSYAVLIAAVAVQRAPARRRGGRPGDALQPGGGAHQRRPHAGARVGASGRGGALPRRAQQQRRRVAPEPAVADRPLAGAGMDPDGQRLLASATS